VDFGDIVGLSYLRVKDFNILLNTELIDEYAYLNDEIMNCAITVMQNDENLKANARELVEDPHLTQQVPRALLFSSFFVVKTMQGSFDEPHRWIKKFEFDVFRCERWIFPIHLRRKHWCVVEYNLKFDDYPNKKAKLRGVLRYYDSLKNYDADTRTTSINSIRDFIIKLLEVKAATGRAEEKQLIQMVQQTDIPVVEGPNVIQQEDGHNCGLYSLIFAECLLRSETPERTDFNNTAMLRRNLAWRLLSKSEPPKQTTSEKTSDDDQVEITRTVPAPSHPPHLLL
jgi:Ulp1 family protease